MTQETPPRYIATNPVYSFDDLPDLIESGGDKEMSLADLIVVGEDIDYTINEYTTAQTLSEEN